MSVALHPVAQAIARAFEIKDGRLVMAEAAARTCVDRLHAVPEAERGTVADHLVMVALRMKQEGGDAALGGVALVVAFVVEVFGEGKAADLFGAAGLGDELARATGAAPRVLPSQEQRHAAVPSVKAKRGLKRD